MNNLPATTTQRTRLIPLRREIANVNARPERHLRHYKSGKVALVNPEVKQKYVPVPVKISSKPPQVRGIILPSVSMLPPKNRTPAPDPVDKREQDFIRESEESLKSILKDLYKLDKEIRNGSEDAMNKLDAYALDMSYREDDGYWQYLIDWGGPSDEFRINEYGDVEFWHKDWFQGHRIPVTGLDAELIKRVTEWEEREAERSINEGFKEMEG